MSTVNVRVLRQDRPELESYWQTFRLVREPGMNVTSLLQQIAAQPTTASGQHVTPVAYEASCLEEVCGSCTMLINGRVRQACSALVDRLVDGNGGTIELRPLSKFPVIRDLLVDRTRLFRALEKLHCWIPVDGYFDRGPGPRQTMQAQQQAYPLSECMSCGCCLEACPQYLRVDVARVEGESEADFEARRNAAYDQSFVGAHANSQVVLMNLNPTGRMNAAQRLKALMAPGGIQNCGKAANCEAVCPKEIPLMTSWARAGRATTVYAWQQLFGSEDDVRSD